MDQIFVTEKRSRISTPRKFFNILFLSLNKSLYKQVFLHVYKDAAASSHTVFFCRRWTGRDLERRPQPHACGSIWVWRSPDSGEVAPGSGFLLNSKCCVFSPSRRCTAPVWWHWWNIVLFEALFVPSVVFEISLYSGGVSALIADGLKAVPARLQSLDRTVHAAFQNDTQSWWKRPLAVF